MNAFEAKRIADAANHKYSEDVASDILNTIDSVAKKGCILNLFLTRYPPPLPLIMRK